MIFDGILHTNAPSARHTSGCAEKGDARQYAGFMVEMNETLNSAVLEESTREPGTISL